MTAIGMMQMVVGGERTATRMMLMGGERTAIIGMMLMVVGGERTGGGMMVMTGTDDGWTTATTGSSGKRFRSLPGAKAKGRTFFVLARA